AHGMLAVLVLPVLVLGWTMADASDGKVDAAEKPWFCHDLDCPTFTLVAEHEGFQERAYEATRWVMTRVEGKPYERAVVDGFMILFRYIGGYNRGGVRVPMTAPVLCHVTPKGARAEHNLTVSFFVPPGSGEPPAPSDPRVEFTSLPAMTAFVSSFDGYAMERDWLHQSQLLAKALDDAKLPYQLGSFHSAGYDPPFRPINRHNEVWIMKAE
uniref:Heme-binding protein 1 n=1 Tax=Petromyzon marinus TaxID=7757 RepID=S4RZK6_PETMA